MEEQILTLEQYINESYQYNKEGLTHQHWVYFAKKERRKRIEELIINLDRTEASILNYASGRQVPNEVIRQDISNIIEKKLLWVIEKKYFITSNQ